MAQIYFSRQKSDSGSGQPCFAGRCRELGGFSSRDTRSVSRDEKPPSSRHLPAKQGCPLPESLFVSKNKFESPTAAFFCNQISLKSNFLLAFTIFPLFKSNLFNSNHLLSFFSQLSVVGLESTEIQLLLLLCRHVSARYFGFRRLCQLVADSSPVRALVVRVGWLVPVSSAQLKWQLYIRCFLILERGAKYE